ncbi:MAG: nickel pincer cofactor biosynthesis protein LarC [Phycisphaerae bacterium]
MKLAHFDCFCGASGDMIVASLLDASADAGAVRQALDMLGVKGYAVSVEKVNRQGFAATRFCVKLDEKCEQPRRRLRDIGCIVEASSLAASSKSKVMRVFERLAKAEAAVHGTTIEQVHFHEVGAVDAIVDVAAAVIALDLLDVQRVSCSPVPVGSGTVECAHGTLPVPAPATAELLKGVPVGSCDEVGELTTPTGAALLTTLAAGFGPLPAMTMDAIGYGAGARTGQRLPNLLRVIIGRGAADGETDQICVLETNIDDASGEIVGYCIDRVLEAGALDAFAVPIHMKKSRTGILLTVLCRQDHVNEIETLLFAETTTFGVRRYTAQRSKMVRKHEMVATPYGEIRVKIGERAGVVTVAPEYEDCRRAARETGAALRDVIASASRAWADMMGRT